MGSRGGPGAIRAGVRVDQVQGAIRVRAGVVVDQGADDRTKNSHSNLAVL